MQLIQSNTYNITFRYKKKLNLNLDNGGNTQNVRATAGHPKDGEQAQVQERRRGGGGGPGMETYKL